MPPLPLEGRLSQDRAYGLDSAGGAPCLRGVLIAVLRGWANRMLRGTSQRVNYIRLEIPPQGVVLGSRSMLTAAFRSPLVRFLNGDFGQHQQPRWVGSQATDMLQVAIQQKRPGRLLLDVWPASQNFSNPEVPCGLVVGPGFSGFC
jgi:hypothetical protein